MTAMHLIADRDRDRASVSLRRHYLRGRLTVEELAERTEIALRARTNGDLRGALRGLPPPWSPGELASAADSAARTAKRILVLAGLAALWWVASVVLLVAFVVVFAADASTEAVLAVPALWVALTCVLWRTGRRTLAAR
jgi:hypothetical protein